MRYVGRIALVLLLAGRAAAAGPGLTADTNIVTAIDGSESVSGADMRLQLKGLAAAMRDPALLAAIHAGATGRASFALFIWHDGQFDVVPWTLVASEADAETVARAVEARMSVRLDAEARMGPGMFIGRLTDLSSALDHARDLLRHAPFDAPRAVVNVIANGPDNMGEAAAPARDRLLAAGATVNGVAMGDDPELPAYFRAEVAGGGGAFVMQGRPDGGLAEMLRRKFLRDLVAGGEAPAGRG